MKELSSEEILELEERAYSELFPQYQTIMGDLVITNAFQELLLTETSVDNVAAKAKEEIEAIMEAK